MEKTEKVGNKTVHAELVSTSVQPVNSQFPPTFNAYYQKKLLSTTIHLGEHADQPLYAVKLPKWRSAIVLHSGPNDKYPQLASAGDGGKLGCHTLVTLPPLPNSTEDSSSEVMRTSVHLKTTTYNFSIDVGAGRHARRENFEWRSSRSDEIRELDKHSRGWKLVRLDSNGQGYDTANGERSVAMASDGAEVVAIWAVNSGFSMTKGSKFQFLGSGLTGELGDRWAIMAVITALRIWYMEFIAVVVVT